MRFMNRLLTARRNKVWLNPQLLGSSGRDVNICHARIGGQHTSSSLLLLLEELMRRVKGEFLDGGVLGRADTRLYQSHVRRYKREALDTLDRLCGYGKRARGADCQSQRRRIEGEDG